MTFVQGCGTLHTYIMYVTEVGGACHVHVVCFDCIQRGGKKLKLLSLLVDELSSVVAFPLFVVASQ